MPRLHPGAVLRRSVAVLLVAAATTGCRTGGDNGGDLQPPVAAGDAAGVKNLDVDVVQIVPHDPSAYTQGLQFDETGRLFESTGIEGRSSIREVDPTTGAVLRAQPLDPDVFGEGLALVGDRLIQLSWQEQKAFVYDRNTFELLESFEYAGEGWGLCYDGTRLVMSNGSDRLTFRDPATFAVLGDVPVAIGPTPIFQLNELECVGDRVYANIWQTDRIVEIDPGNGAVTAVIDASGLPKGDGGEVLNGIAVEPDGDMWITGKLWSSMFRVDLVPV